MQNSKSMIGKKGQSLKSAVMSLVASAAMMAAPVSQGAAGASSPVPGRIFGDGGHSELFEKAHAIYQDGMKKGYFTSKVEFLKNTDPDMEASVAYVVPDLNRGVCKVYLSDEAFKASGLSGAGEFRFTILHELSHCELYLSPSEMTMLPGASATANRMLSDLVQIEYLHGSAPKRLNGYNIYHETYADIKALAILVREKAPASEIAFVADFRAKNTAVMDTHQTLDAVKAASTMKWSQMDLSRVDQTARDLAAQSVIASFLDRTFDLRTITINTSELLDGALREPLSNLRFKYADKDNQAFIVRRLDEVSNSNSLLWATYAALAKSGLSNDDMIESFFKIRYGADKADLEDADEEIANGLASAMAPKVHRTAMR